MSRSVPTPSKISQPFWDSCKAEHMQIQRCEDCSTYAFYPVYICPECASRKLVWTPVSGKGVIHTFTVAEKSSFETEGPLVVALVELEEGAMMVSNIKTTAPDALSIGAPVQLTYEKVSDEITLLCSNPPDRFAGDTHMKIATVETASGQRPAVVVEDTILDIASAWELSGNGNPPGSVLDIVANPDLLSALRQVVAKSGADLWSPLAEAKLLAPIPRPAKNVFCVGRNYKLHIEEGARARGVPAEYPPLPEFFTKTPTSVIGPEAQIRLPNNTQKLDYEVELAFVVGRTGRDISMEAALSHIFGFTVLNDVTARDLQRSHGQWFKGKSLDTTCPLGPWIVTADEFDVTQEHRLWLTVNGETRQDAFISDMVFDCAAILSSLSSGMTVETGDIITTGTPSGVGVGLGLDPQVWLKDGDVIEAGIEGIGSIRNTVKAV